jgi:hypothetical protein
MHETLDIVFRPAGCEHECPHLLVVRGVGAHVLGGLVHGSHAKTGVLGDARQFLVRQHLRVAQRHGSER